MIVNGITYTHKGWFGMCPMFIGKLNSECPDLLPRHWAFMPLAHLAVFLQGIAISTCAFFNPHWTPVWAIRVTGILK